MNKKAIFIVLVFIFIICLTSGCLEYINVNSDKIIYESHPTKVSYIISYGYQVNCTGKGNYNIEYNCDKPEVLLGIVTITDILYDKDYNEKILFNNDLISWKINDGNNNNDIKQLNILECLGTDIAIRMGKQK